ncbi:MAG: hypothetical protein RL297_602 [Pseudomonadota bacterium]|jgi:hypothetical protein
MAWLADLVLAIHFAIAAFIAAGLVLIPVGFMRGWAWVRWRRLRLTHAGLMVFVAAEAVVGMTCPLTLIEAHLRGTEAPSSFLGVLAAAAALLGPATQLLFGGLCGVRHVDYFSVGQVSMQNQIPLRPQLGMIYWWSISEY